MWVGQLLSSGAGMLPVFGWHRVRGSPTTSVKPDREELHRLRGGGREEQRAVRESSVDGQTHIPIAMVFAIGLVAVDFLSFLGALVEPRNNRVLVLPTKDQGSMCRRDVAHRTDAPAQPR